MTFSKFVNKKNRQRNTRAGFILRNRYQFYVLWNPYLFDVESAPPLRFNCCRILPQLSCNLKEFLRESAVYKMEAFSDETILQNPLHALEGRRHEKNMVSFRYS